MHPTWAVGLRSVVLAAGFPCSEPNQCFFCLVLSREWGKWIMEILVGDDIGTTIGIHSPIPY